MNKKEQIKTEFTKLLGNDDSVRQRLTSAVNLFRQHLQESRVGGEKAIKDSQMAFLKISELVTRSYASKEVWEEKENIFISSISRESTGNPRPDKEARIIDELRINAHIGYLAIVTDKMQGDHEFSELWSATKRYYSQFWEKPSY